MRFLRQNQLFEICWCKLIQTEKAQVRKNTVHLHVVAIQRRMQLVEHLVESLEEVFVAHTAIENLLHEHFLIWVFHLYIQQSMFD